MSWFCTLENDEVTGMYRNKPGGIDTTELQDDDQRILDFNEKRDKPIDDDVALVLKTWLDGGTPDDIHPSVVANMNARAQGHSRKP
jgi:hypothetical protein